MMKRKLTVVAALALTFFVSACTVKENKPAEIRDLQVYNDPILNFSVKYPSNWVTRRMPGSQFVAVSSEPALERFVNYASEGEAGARVQVVAIQANGRSLDAVLNEQMIFEKSVYSAPQPFTLGGASGQKISYGFDLADGRFQGETYIAQGDSGLVTMVDVAAFSGTFDAYRAHFDEIIQSVQLAMPALSKPQQVDTIVTPAEPQPPSDTLRAFSGQGFSIQVPQNFTSSRGTAKNALSSTVFMGDRRDCSIQIDVLDASKQKDLNKIVESNKPVYKATTATPTKLGGVNASYINYSLVSNVSSRVYFAVHNNKLYRITLNWYQPQQSEYLPVFEKSVNTLRFM